MKFLRPTPTTGPELTFEEVVGVIIFGIWGVLGNSALDFFAHYSSSDSLHSNFLFRRLEWLALGLLLSLVYWLWINHRPRRPLALSSHPPPRQSPGGIAVSG